MSNSEQKDWQAVIDEADKSEEQDKVSKNKSEEDNSFAAEAKAAFEDQPTVEVQGAEDLQKKLAEAEQKAIEHYEMALRATSEAENVKRRADQERQKVLKFGNEKILKELLPVVDSLEQAILAMGEDETMRQGVELTLKMFLDVLAKSDVQQLDPVGETFDPNVHEAMSMMPATEEHAANSVVQVFQKGYLLNGRLIRPARVIVAQ